MTRVLNKKYWPYAIELPNTDSILNTDPRQEWLEKNVKNGNYATFGYRPTTYAFRNESDAIWFKLRWG